MTERTEDKFEGTLVENIGEPRAWERQDGETKKQWEAFRAWRDLGPSRNWSRWHLAYKGKPLAEGKRVAGSYRQLRADKNWDERAKMFDRAFYFGDRDLTPEVLTDLLNKWRKERLDDCEDLREIARDIFARCSDAIKTGELEPSPQLLRAAIQALNEATEQQAKYMGITEILEIMGDEMATPDDGSVH